jgi:hypothetical protein
MRDARNALDRLSVRVDDPVVIAALAIIESMDEHSECISAQIHEMNTTLKRPSDSEGVQNGHVW